MTRLTQKLNAAYEVMLKKAWRKRTADDENDATDAGVDGRSSKRQRRGGYPQQQQQQAPPPLRAPEPESPPPEPQAMAEARAGIESAVSSRLPAALLGEILMPRSLRVAEPQETVTTHHDTEPASETPFISARPSVAARTKRTTLRNGIMTSSLRM